MSLPPLDESPRRDRSTVTVVVADDDPLARRVVRETLEEAGFTVAGEARSGAEAVELAVEHRPDVVLMDVVMPGLDGIAAAQRILDSLPRVKVVMLSMSSDDHLGLLALRIGAAGYLTKDMDMARLPHALEGVIAGEAAISRRLTATLVEQLRGGAHGGEGLRPVRSPLTPREWEVLDLLCRGASTAGVAEELVLSPETVRTHVKHILRKLHVSSRAEAVKRARELRDGPLVG